MIRHSLSACSLELRQRIFWRGNESAGRDMDLEKRKRVAFGLGRSFQVQPTTKIGKVIGFDPLYFEGVIFKLVFAECFAFTKFPSQWGTIRAMCLADP